MADEEASKKEFELPQPLAGAHQLTEETAQRLIKVMEASLPVRYIRGSLFLSTFIVALGFGFFMYGVHELAAELPLIHIHYVAIITGCILMASVGAYYKKMGASEVEEFLVKVGGETNSH